MKNLILIGMPGAGKSTLGVILAKTLGMDFLDTDLVVCRRADATLQTILNEKGQEYFLDFEEQVTLTLMPEMTVVATGGSVPLREKAMKHLKTLGKVIYLQVPYEELESRLSNIRTRGIAFGPGQTLRSLYEERCPIYEKWADLTVSVDLEENHVEHMVEKILSML